MSSLFFAPLGAIRFMLFQVRSISLALLLCLTNSTYADRLCGDDAQTETLLPNYDFIAGWGVRINRVQAGYPEQEVEIQKRPDIEYEQDQRITYEEEDVSITQFWQGCESFIGRQAECESDESFSTLITPDQLDDFLVSQGSLINHDPESIMSFAEPNDEFWRKSDNPIIEKMFKFSMNKDEISALGDFKQISFRQAIRITMDVNQHLDQFYFEDTQLPFSLLTSKEGLYVDSKVILKAMYISSGDQESAYIPLRGLIPENYSKPWCQENTCGIEFLSKDILNIEYIHKQFSEWPPEGAICYGYDMKIGWLSAGAIDYNYTEIEKAIFHYEIQTSIINTKGIEDFSPMDYMGRDFTLPKEKGGGGLHYLLVILVLLTSLKKTQTNHQWNDEV